MKITKNETQINTKQREAKITKKQDTDQYRKKRGEKNNKETQINMEQREMKRTENETHLDIEKMEDLASQETLQENQQVVSLEGEIEQSQQAHTKVDISDLQVTGQVHQTLNSHHNSFETLHV